MRSRKSAPTNVEFVRDLMEHSKYGALVQPFVIEALDQYSKTVVANQEQYPEDHFISKTAWIGIAKEVQQKVKDRYQSIS